MLTFVLFAVDREDVDIPHDVGARVTDSTGPVSEDYKMLLNCLEHVNHTMV
jgi:hypothetical protein